MGYKNKNPKIDVDKNRPIADSLNISGVPTPYRKMGKRWRQSGVQRFKQLQSIINQK